MDTTYSYTNGRNEPGQQLLRRFQNEERRTTKFGHDHADALYPPAADREYPGPDKNETKNTNTPL